jgi:hypothetical protein
MKAPRATRDLDPKLYPLASTPTPSSLRNIKFEMAGRSVVFNEPEDPRGALEEVCSARPPASVSYQTLKSNDTNCNHS